MEFNLTTALENEVNNDPEAAVLLGLEEDDSHNINEELQHFNEIKNMLFELRNVDNDNKLTFCKINIFPKFKHLSATLQDVAINELTKVLKPLGIGKPAIKKEINIRLRQADGQIGEKKASIEDESPYFIDGTFIPKLLADDIMSKHKFIYSGEELREYINGVYAPGGEESVRKLSLNLLGNNFKKRRYEETLFIIETLSMKKIYELNKNIFLINVKNGMYDVPKRILLPHDPEYLSTIQLNCNYNPGAKCPIFISYLNRALEPDSQILIQEIAGYLLIIDTRAQKAFLLYGPGGSGKSTFLYVMLNLLGTTNCSAISLQDLTDRFRVANLANKLANICPDIPAKPLEDAAIFKSIVGEDTITAERKFKQPFEFKPYARLIFSANQFPRTLDKTSAFFRRWIVAGFNNVIPENERDLQLKAKLLNELDGIFLWALEGLERLIANNFRFSETNESKDLVEKYKRESNNVLTFVDEKCIIQPDVYVSRSGLYSEYKTWCVENGYKPFSQRSFNDEIELNFKEKVWRGLHPNPRIRTKIYRGIALIDSKDDSNINELTIDSKQDNESDNFDWDYKRW